MHYAVRIENVVPRPLAAVRGSASRNNLGQTIIQLLDQVWPVLRAQALETGHNVVVYHGGPGDIEAGVEILGGTLIETDVVKHAQTPAGRVVTVSHFGDYAAVGAAYTALDRACQEHNYVRTPLSWEVYGDWSDNPAERRMDVYWLLT